MLVNELQIHPFPKSDADKAIIPGIIISKDVRVILEKKAMAEHRRLTDYCRNVLFKEAMKKEEE